MRDNRWIIPCVHALACVFASAAIVVAARAEEESTQDLHRAPEKPLDPRIKVEKITEQEPPPPPELIVLPLPPDHRIAQSAEQVPMSAAHWERALDAVRKGLAYLRTTQDENGGWMMDATATPTDQPDKPSPIAVAVTALAVKAIVQIEPEARNSPELRRAIRFIYAAKNEDGSFEAGR